jgi:chitinase
MPREKILLGLPFYGYGWQTDSSDPKANTYKDTGFTVSYKKVKDLLNLSEGGQASESAWLGATQIKKSFDNDALSPFITYQQDDELYTIYYEDPESIAYKLEYARQLDLAGIAIWALGYEDNERELWEVIANGI